MKIHCINGCGLMKETIRTKPYKNYNIDYETLVCEKCGAEAGTKKMASSLQIKMRLIDEWERKTNKDIICK